MSSRGLRDLTDLAAYYLTDLAFQASRDKPLG
jgi:hypothetical protein